MVVKYNKNSNGTKKTKEKIQWKCNVNTNERTCILRHDQVKKSTQQSLCINFVRRRSSATLGNLKLNCSWHCITRAISDVLNSFINSSLITKSDIAYIYDVFMQPRRMTLWPWLLTLTLFLLLRLACSNYTPILIILGYRILSYELLNLITFPLAITVTSYAPCHVTYHWRAQMVHTFETLDPNSLCYFQGATPKIQPCYCRKIAFFPLWRLQSSLRMRSITSPVHRVPQTTRNNFWPMGLGLRWRLRVVYIGASHVKAIFECKKN